MEKQRHIELMGLSLFLTGLCGIFLFFYMAIILFVDFPAMDSMTSTDSAAVMGGFIAYLIRLMVPILILLVVGAISLLVAHKGISVYSGEPKQKT